MSDSEYLLEQSKNDIIEETKLEFLIEQVLNRRNHATLVKVVRAPYDASGDSISPGSAVSVGYVDVQPLIRQVDGWGLPVPHETVYHLSYHRYQGGNNAVICDPTVGDIGKMIVADRDTSIVKSTGQQANPGSQRRSNFADGTYFGVPQGSAPTQYLAFLSEGFTLVDSYGNTIQGTETGLLLNGIRISQAGEIYNTQDTAFGTHTHPYLPGSGSETETGPPEAGS